MSRYYESECDSDEIKSLGAKWKLAQTLVENAEEHKRSYIDEQMSLIHKEAAKRFDSEIVRMRSEANGLWSQFEDQLIKEALEDSRVGKRVIKKEYASKTYKSGIIEVCTRESEFSKTLEYSRPKVGSLFVRLLKADGMPSLNADNSLYGWVIVEESK